MTFRISGIKTIDSIQRNRMLLDIAINFAPVTQDPLNKRISASMLKLWLKRDEDKVDNEH